MDEAFWWNKNNRERVGNRPAHLICRSYDTEDEAGCINDVYVAYCGEEMESWDSVPIEKVFGSLEEAIKDGAEICEKCLEIKNKSKTISEDS